MRVAYLFPGQGSQKVGMGKDFFEQFESVQTIFEEAEHQLKIPLKKLCFQGPQNELNLTTNTQPALLTVSAAISSVINDVQEIPKPDFVAGHSLGEYTALWYAGVFPLSTALNLVRKRGEYMQMAVPPDVGAMAAIIGISSSELEKICNEVRTDNFIVQTANYNAPGQIVISGHKKAVITAMEKAKISGAKKGILLPVSAPFHSILMEQASVNMVKEINKANFNTPTVDIINNADAKILPKTREDIKSSLIRQITFPVKWEQSIRLMDKLGIDTYIEIGSGRVLTNLVKRIVPHSKRFSVSSISEFIHLRSYFTSGSSPEA